MDCSSNTPPKRNLPTSIFKKKALVPTARGSMIGGTPAYRAPVMKQILFIYYLAFFINKCCILNSRNIETSLQNA